MTIWAALLCLLVFGFYFYLFTYKYWNRKQVEKIYERNEKELEKQRALFPPPYFNESYPLKEGHVHKDIYQGLFTEYKKGTVIPIKSTFLTVMIAYGRRKYSFDEDGSGRPGTFTWSGDEKVYKDFEGGMNLYISVDESQKKESIWQDRNEDSNRENNKNEGENTIDDPNNNETNEIHNIYSKLNNLNQEHKKDIEEIIEKYKSCLESEESESDSEDKLKDSNEDTEEWATGEDRYFISDTKDVENLSGLYSKFHKSEMVLREEYEKIVSRLREVGFLDPFEYADRSNKS